MSKKQDLVLFTLDESEHLTHKLLETLDLPHDGLTFEQVVHSDFILIINRTYEKIDGLK